MKNSNSNIKIFQNIQFKVFNEINDILNSNNVNFFFTRGFTLSIRLHKDPFIRKSCDIDIFIHSDDIHKALRLLLQNRYIPEYSADIIKKIFIPFSQEFTLYKIIPGFNIKIDVHTFHSDRFGFNTSDYFNNIQRLKWKGKYYNVLNMRFEFLYFLDHYFKHYRQKDKYRSDLKSLFKKNPGYKNIFNRFKYKFENSFLYRAPVKGKMREFFVYINKTSLLQKIYLIFRHFFIPFKNDILLFEFKHNWVFLYLLIKPLRSVIAVFRIFYAKI